MSGAGMAKRQTGAWKVLVMLMVGAGAAELFALPAQGQQVYQNVPNTNNVGDTVDRCYTITGISKNTAIDMSTPAGKSFWQCVDRLANAYGGTNKDDRCQHYSDKLTDAVKEFGGYCTAVSDKTRPSTSGSSNRASRAFDQCIDDAKECSSEEDIAGDALLATPDSGDDIDTGKQCNAMGAAQAEDLKSQEDQYEKDRADLKQQMVTAQSTADAAAKQDGVDAQSALTAHQSAITQFQSQMSALQNGWAKTQQDSNSDAAKQSGELQQAFDQAVQDQQKAGLVLRKANDDFAQAKQDAIKACEDNANKVMVKLETDRINATAAFLNNTGSISKLATSLTAFEAQFGRAYNYCITHDGARTMANAQRALSEATAAYNLELQAVATQKTELQQSLQRMQQKMQGDLLVAHQAYTSNVANTAQQITNENAQYNASIKQLNDASEARKRTEQQNMINLNQQLQVLQAKMMTNDAQMQKLAAAGIQNPGAATTKATEKRQTRSRGALAAFAEYRSAWCNYRKFCCQDPGTPNPGECPALADSCNANGAAATPPGGTVLEGLGGTTQQGTQQTGGATGKVQ